MRARICRRASSPSACSARVRSRWSTICEWRAAGLCDDVARLGGGVMRVVRLRAPGGLEQLALEEADRPRAAPGEALVRVHAAAITHGELEWPLDRLPAIPSYELSGVVDEVGPGASGVAAGDAVYALTPFDPPGGPP